MIKPKDVPFPIGYGPATYKAHGKDFAFKGGEFERFIGNIMDRCV